MSTLIEKLEQSQLRRVPAFAPGDRVKVHFQVVEGNRRRTQVFEGVVIKRQGEGARETFTVRKQSFGVGVERTFPVHSPKIEKIEVASRGEVRRAKLYYLRDRVGKGARVRESEYAGPEEEVEPGLVHAPEPEAQDATEAQGGPDEPQEPGGDSPEGEETAQEPADEAPDGDETAPDEAEAAAPEPEADEPSGEEEPAAAEAPDADEEPAGEGSSEEAPGGDADGDAPPADEA